MAVRKSVRFEVFKRDSFTCQYCGRPAPEVILEADHIRPVSKGGVNDMMNLVTSCRDCNAGKSNRELSDASAVEKRKQQADEVQARREQIELMSQWQCDLIQLQDREVEQVEVVFQSLVPGRCLTERSRGEFRKTIRHCGLGLTLESLRNARDDYLQFDNEGNAILESVDAMVQATYRYARCRKAVEERPELKEFLYIRAIVRNRCRWGNFVDWEALHLIKRAYDAGVTLDCMKQIAREYDGDYRKWQNLMEMGIDDVPMRGAED